MYAITGSEVFTLPCAHAFHARCIKGWVLIGKKNSCPCCCARVELASITGATMLARPSLLWAQMLSLARYLVVWLPLLVAATRFILFEAGVVMPTPHVHNATGAPLPAALSQPRVLGANGSGQLLHAAAA